MKNFLLFALLFITAMSLPSCGGDDEPEEMDDDLPAMSITFTYEDTTYTVTDASLVDATMANSTLDGINVRHWSCTIEVENGDELELSVQNIREQEAEGGLRIKTYDTAPVDCESPGDFEVCEEGNARINLDEGGTIRTDLGDPVGSFTVTANDTEQNILSGNFTMQVKRFGSTQPLQTLEGSFENIHYLAFF